MFQIIKEKKLKNGEVRIEYEVTEEFVVFVKAYYNKKRFTTKLANRAILEALYNYQKVELEKNFKHALVTNGIKI